MSAAAQGEFGSPPKPGAKSGNRTERRLRALVTHGPAKGGRSEAKTTAVDHLNDVGLGAPPTRVPLSTHLSESYGDDMEILYIAASGQSDATRASIPWHLAVNGSFEAGQSTGILLLGDAAEVLVPQVRDAIEGLGIAPLRDLLSKARDTSLPVFV